MAERSRILVVDDETQITRVLKTTLGSQGYEVRTAADGESGFDMAMDWLPDLVITDVSMPKMSGADLCRAIRERSQVPIIVLSVRGEERHKIEALDAGDRPVQDDRGAVAEQRQGLLHGEERPPHVEVE